MTRATVTGGGRKQGSVGGLDVVAQQAEFLDKRNQGMEDLLIAAFSEASAEVDEGGAAGDRLVAKSGKAPMIGLTLLGIAQDAAEMFDVGYFVEIAEQGEKKEGDGIVAGASEDGVSMARRHLPGWTGKLQAGKIPARQLLGLDEIAQVDTERDAIAEVMVAVDVLSEQRAECPDRSLNQAQDKGIELPGASCDGNLSVDLNRGSNSARTGSACRIEQSNIRWIETYLASDGSRCEKGRRRS